MNGLGVGEAVAVFELVQLARKQKWFDRLKTALRKKHTILILGCTGVGKGNFIKSLSEIAPKAIDRMNRTEFPSDHRLRISKNLFTFIDTPGQVAHASRRVRSIRRALSTGISGVINVTAYGYHESRIGKREALTRTGMPRANYLARMRRQEVNALSEWNTILGGRETCGWLINLVTKADLWWHERETVMEHYTEGSYYDALGGAKVLDPVVVEYCSVLHRFFGEAPLSGIFDEEDRVRTRGNLLRILLEAVSR